MIRLVTSFTRYFLSVLWKCLGSSYSFSLYCPWSQHASFFQWNGLIWNYHQLQAVSISVFSWCKMLDWCDWRVAQRASPCRLDFNEAGVLTDSCVCACCHGFQLSSGAVQREERLAENEVLPHFHPTSDLLMWTNCHVHRVISIQADLVFVAFYVGRE